MRAEVFTTAAGKGKLSSAFCGAHQRTFEGASRQAVRRTENPLEGLLIVGSHRLTTGK